MRLAQLTPRTLPEVTGERHMFTTKAQVVAFYDTFQGWDTCELVLRRAPDRSYAVDVLENPPVTQEVRGNRES